MTEAWAWIQPALGIGADTLSAAQMALRGIMMYIVALVILRVGSNRFLGKNTAGKQ